MQRTASLGSGVSWNIPPGRYVSHQERLDLVIRELLTSARWKDASPGSLEWLAKLLREEGIDLMTADSADLERGTPVYVDAGADVIEVQRLMAKNHIRVLPVVRGGKVQGVVDLLELAMREDLAPDATVGEAASA